MKKSGLKLKLVAEILYNRFQYMKLGKNICRERAKMVPKLPSTTLDLNISGKWSLTKSDDDFVIADETVANKRILIYGTKETVPYT